MLICDFGTNFFNPQSVKFQLSNFFLFYDTTFYLFYSTTTRDYYWCKHSWSMGSVSGEPTLEAVLQALRVLYHSPDTSEKERASTWLEEYQKSVSSKVSRRRSSSSSCCIRLADQQWLHTIILNQSHAIECICLFSSTASLSPRCILLDCSSCKLPLL